MRFSVSTTVNTLSDYAMVAVSEEDGILVSDHSKDRKIQGDVVGR